MNFVTFLQTNTGARTIFGKRELVIIQKQLWGVPLTQSEKNRLSRDIRKKFQFIKNISKYSEEFEIKKGARVKEIVQDTLTLIKEDQAFKKIKRILLYGSTVDNTRTPMSDIDIAIEFTTTTNSEATIYRKRISGKVHEKVDIQVFNTLPIKIQTTITKNLKVLYP